MAPAHQGKRVPDRVRAGGVSIRSASRSESSWQSRTFLWLAIWLGAIYWVFGQGFGGLATGGATDVNSGLLWIVLACALFTTLPQQAERREPARARMGNPEGALG